MPSRTHHLSAVVVFTAVLTALTAVAWAGPAQANPREAVVEWNSAATDILQKAAVDPLNQSRMLAVLHAAVHDALNTIEPRYQAYTSGLLTGVKASPAAAVAAASRQVLVTMIPSAAASIEAEYLRALAEVRDGAAKQAGIGIGQACAIATLDRRALDGMAGVNDPIYATNHKPGDYQFTSPFDTAFFPGWGRMTPFGIELEQHKLPGPTTLSSALYAIDFGFVKAIGGKTSTLRSAEQTEIAQFWYEDSPIGWNRIANTVIRQRRLDAWEAARTLALVNFAMADGFIAGFEAKYRFRFWRPITAIQGSVNDGNVWTEADPTWEPFLVTPGVPDYPSTHTVLGSAAAEVLISVFGDRIRYSATSSSLPGVTRHFRGFSSAATENGASRVFAGLHFVNAVVDGYQQGQSIGRAVARLLPAIE